jgi:hypothetical protein
MTPNIPEIPALFLERMSRLLGGSLTGTLKLAPASSGLGLEGV